MGILLFVLSLGLILLLAPVGLSITFVYNFLRYNWRYACKKINYDLIAISISIDATGNVVCKDMLNLLMRKKDGYLFGRRKETISSVLGKNQVAGTLTWCGRQLAGFLDWLDKDHCIKAIDLAV